jgi:glycosyltransferase involved in cell wall biosynthesis
MGERKRIGICYTYSENWIGGTYYIENLIHALNCLQDSEKPQIILIANHYRDFEVAKKKLDYPYITFQIGSGEKNKLFQFLNKVCRRFFNKTAFEQRIRDLDAVFPYYKCLQQSLAKKKIYWIADFQEHFAPAFFNEETITAIRDDQLQIQSSSENLVLSSNDSLEHFKMLYPDHHVKTYVLPFAVTHPDFRHLEIETLLKKFGLTKPYFICPNQFWKHKNQIIVLKAVNELKDKGLNITIAFTGKTQDYRNPAYFAGLEEYIQSNGLKGHIKFLGFIDRLEQLQLMNNSLAIIQPSLFEGWSTVVEDAKAMNKSLFVSNIAVHQEQLVHSSAVFFDPYNEKALATAMEQTLVQRSSPGLYAVHNYQKYLQEFGRNFLAISVGHAGFNSSKCNDENKFA